MRMHWSMKTFAALAGLSLALSGCGDDSTTDTGSMASTGSNTTGADSTGADSSGGGGPPFGSDEDVMMAAQLWTDIQGWDQWGQIPGLEGVVPSEAPHEAFAEIFINDVAAGDPTYPDGSILLKENVSDEAGESITAITVMMRVDGFEPMAGDWFWAKYLPDGTLDMNPDGVPLAGRVGLGGEMGCIPCHGMATGGDFVYSND